MIHNKRIFLFILFVMHASHVIASDPKALVRAEDKDPVAKLRYDLARGFSKSGLPKDVLLIALSYLQYEGEVVCPMPHSPFHAMDYAVAAMFRGAQYISKINPTFWLMKEAISIATNEIEMCNLESPAQSSSGPCAAYAAWCAEVEKSHVISPANRTPKGHIRRIQSPTNKASGSSGPCAAYAAWRDEIEMCHLESPASRTPKGNMRRIQSNVSNDSQSPFLLLAAPQSTN